MDDNPYTAVIIAAVRALFESPYLPVFILLFVLHVAALRAEPRKDGQVQFFD